MADVDIAYQTPPEFAGSIVPDRARAIASAMVPGGGPTDTTPPVVGSWLPVDGSTIVAADAVQVDVTDETSLGSFVVWATYGLAAEPDLLYDGTALTPSATGSVSDIAGGKRVSVGRAGGWGSDPIVLHVRAVDAAGNATETSASYPVSNPVTPPVPDTTAPTIGTWDPVDGSLIGHDNSVSVRVTDDVGIASNAVELYAVFDDGRAEVVYANGAFALGYLGGLLTLLPDGWQVLALRTEGWPTAGLTLRATGTDAAGNRATASASYTITDPTLEGEKVEPVVANFSPPTTQSLGRSDPLFFDVVDNSGTFRAILVWAWSGDTAESPELAHDGAAFTARYAGLSTRSPTTTPALVEAVAVGPYALTDGMTLLVSVDGGAAQTLTVHTADFVDIGAATPSELAALLGALTGVTSGVLDDEGGERVRVGTVGTGPTATLQITGGTANAVVRFPTTLATGGSGYHYRLRRRGGWPVAAGNTSPTLTVGVKALDASGNATP